MSVGCSKEWKCVCIRSISVHKKDTGRPPSIHPSKIDGKDTQVALQTDCSHQSLPYISSSSSLSLTTITTIMARRIVLPVLLVVGCFCGVGHSFTTGTTPATIGSNTAATARLFSSAPPSAPVENNEEKKKETSSGRKSGYVPKWKKKKTLAELEADSDGGDGHGFSKKGLKGSIAVHFVQGNITRTTVAMPNQPLRDVASQAGQFIKYGCGKGECGTCECRVGDKWMRPCVATVPSHLAAQSHLQPLVVTIKEQSAAKSVSSGKFYSARSFVMGFYNNLLGMVGFVQYRKNAKDNWEERQEYEELVRTLTMEKKQRRREQWELEYQERMQAAALLANNDDAAQHASTIPATSATETKESAVSTNKKLLP